MLSISPSVVFTRVGDEAVLLDFERGVYYGLDGAGARVWELIADGRSLDGVAEAMTAEYEVALDEVRRDVEALVGELERNGLVTR
jgi:hypothetical protein